MEDRFVSPSPAFVHHDLRSPTLQVAALTEYPELINLAKDAFPADVVERAKELLSEIGSIGAYSHSQGVPFIRKSVAKFIEGAKNSRIFPRDATDSTSERDGFPANPNHIFLTAGASAGVSLLIQLLIKPVTANNPSPSGVLIPIPQYPLYTATLAQFSGTPLPYYLDESKGWSTSPAEVEAALAEAKKKGVTPKALVVINPGNPTGALLDEKTQEGLVKLCEEHNLVLLADEVYQSNLHRRQEAPFTSFKKTVRKMNSPVGLISYHSISKGVTGECGRRGGYFECTNFPEEIIALVYKMVGTDGQYRVASWLTLPSLRFRLEFAHPSPVRLASTSWSGRQNPVPPPTISGRRKRTRLMQPSPLVRKRWPND